MFVSKRLANLAIRATVRSPALFPRITKPSTSSNNFTPLAPVSVVIARTYVSPRRGGASSRPVKTKEREETEQSTANIQPHQEAPNPGYYQQQADAPQDYYARYGGATAGEIVNQSVSLQAFLKRCMTTTAAGVGVSAVATAIFIQMPFVYAHPYICLGVGMVGAMGGLFGMAANPPTYVQKGEVIEAVNSPARQAMFGGLVVAEGLAFAPMIGKIAMIAPMALPVAGALAAGTMAGMGIYALKQPQGSLAKWGPALYVGVFGLIGCGLVNIFLHSSILTTATSAIGILIFSAFTAWDTHQAINEHNDGRPDHLLTAANFYLNFVNLFMDYLRLIWTFFED